MFHREKIAKGLIVSGILALLLSAAFPYWHVRVTAPQYPKGLKVSIYLNHTEGDVQEIDSLNHYIGMRPLREAAKTERRLALLGLGVITLCLAAVFFFTNRWSILFSIPLFFFPMIFAADLYWWLRNFGLNLDPHAALSSSVKPFVPPLLGPGKIAQFKAFATFEWGFYLSVLAGGLVFTAFFFRFWKKRPPKLMHAICFLAFLLLFYPGQTYAATLVVGSHRTYQTIQEAIQVASEGDKIIIQKGQYKGPVEINKSLSLEGQGWPVIDGHERGTVVRVAAPDVKVRGLLIRRSGDSLTLEDSGLLVSGARATIENNRFEDVLFGISLHRSPSTAIKNNVLSGKKLDSARRGDLIRVWYSDNVIIEKNQVSNGRDVVLWFSKNLKVIGNIFQGNRYGIHFMYCQDATVVDNVFKNNSVGAYLMYSSHLRLKRNQVLDNRGPSGYGIGFKDMEGAVINRNVIANNRVGMFLDTSVGVHTKNIVAYNDVGIVILPSSQGNRFRANSLVENQTQVSIEGFGSVNLTQWEGNFWSDYKGFDRKRDRIGDIPYQSTHFFEHLVDRNSTLKFFFTSPVHDAIDFASNVFPIFAPRSEFEDPIPSMEPTLSLSGAAPHLSWPWMLVSASLVFPVLRFPRRRKTLQHLKPSPSTPHCTKGNCVVSVNNLSKHFGKVQALKDLSFQVKSGETMILWGSNGAGKTTILKCLLGLLTYEGKLEVLGLDVALSGKSIRKEIGYVPQEIRLHPDQTVWETLWFYGRLRKISAERAQALINEWGLKEILDRRVSHLSGGMKQKVMLVIALLSDPPILLLDEPTSNLDVRVRHEFVSLLARLKQGGKTLIICSHRASEVWKLADRVVVLHEGRKTSEGTPEEVNQYLGNGGLLCITVRKEDCGQAAALIQSRGFLIQHNETQIWIEVPRARKTEPFQLLSDRQIPILDFEMETQDFT